MRVADVMHRDVVTVKPEATFTEAAKVMRHHGISALIVRGRSGPAGIVTERDCVDLLAKGDDPASVALGDRMITDLITCESGTELGEAARIMTDHRIRHLPVVDGRKLVGMISIRDTVGRHPALAQLEQERHKSFQARLADRITAFAGSMPFVYVHIVWFGLWIALGAEGFPYGLLTMLVSLEAIFLATFVMISQNRADERRQVLADHQWELVQQEERQNEEIISLSNRILGLTEAIHELTVLTEGSQVDEPAGPPR
jgi:CBS domain-containing protein